MTTRPILFIALLTTLTFNLPTLRADDLTTLPTTTVTTTTSPTTAPIKIDLSTPTLTVQSLAAAMDANDVPAAQSCLVADPAQDLLVQQLITIMNQVKNFKAAALATFPKDSPPDLAQIPDFSFTQDIVGGLKQTITGNTAVVTPIANPNPPVMALVKVNGLWKFDFSASDDGKRVITQAPQIAAQFKPLDTITANILAGKYKTWDDVGAAMLELSTPPPASAPATLP